MRNMHETVLRIFAIGLVVEYARAYAHNKRAGIVPVRCRDDYPHLADDLHEGRLRHGEE